MMRRIWWSLVEQEEDMQMDMDVFDHILSAPCGTAIITNVHAAVNPSIYKRGERKKAQSGLTHGGHKIKKLRMKRPAA